MTAPIRYLAGALQALVLAASAPALAQTDIVDAPDPFVHAATGVRFPASSGDVRRQRVVRYDDEGYDASVGYRIAGIPHG